MEGFVLILLMRSLFLQIQVMSDEFNVPNRTFADGDDPMWTALDKSDDDMSAGGGSLHFYNSSRVRTEDGYLKINTRYVGVE